jgi:branched-subunit amino acid aminotransferase/4-amino-4-deoxychorismate lyase
MNDTAIFKLVEGRFEPYLSVSSITRATNYADGFFDTLLFKAGEPVFWDAHLKRMEETCAYLGLEGVDPAEIREAFDSITTATPAPWQRVRVNISRSGGGLYFPERNEADVVVQIQRLDQDPWDSDGVLRADLAQMRWATHPSDRYKLLARQENVRLALEAQFRRLDELVVYNQDDRLVGCVAGNLIIRVEGKWFTPPLSDGALAGTLRHRLLASDLIAERSISKDIWGDAEACARTNAITGVLPIGQESKADIQSLRTALFEMRD